MGFGTATAMFVAEGPGAQQNGENSSNHTARAGGNGSDTDFYNASNRSETGQNEENSSNPDGEHVVNLGGKKK